MIHQGLTKSVMKKFNTQNLTIVIVADKNRNEIQKHLGIKDRKYFMKVILNPLIKNKKLLLTIPDKPRSKNQKYVSDGNIV
jgi:ATP-dependent DNA helicase RecG